MAGLPQPLWPIHYKPFPDELLSNLLVRLAHGHGLKVQTFCNLLFGNRRQIWNRDIDRIAPDWLIDALCAHTGARREVIFQTTLRAYEGKLYREHRESSIEKWILPLLMYHRTHRGYGLQFCPHCLAWDAIPYYRKRWRVAFCTYCPTHGVMLHDRCPKCGAPVAFHRLELGHPNQSEVGVLSRCFQCGFDLREAAVERPVFYEESSRQAFELAVLRLEPRGPSGKPRSVRYYNVLHHLCWLLITRYHRLALRDFVCIQVGAPKLTITSGRALFEERPVQERHHLVQLAFWLLADLAPRLDAAWHSRAVTYSMLLRDFDDRPVWFDRVVGRFSDWRRNITP